MKEILGYLGSVAVTAIALYILWFIVTKVVGVAQLGWKGALELLIVGVVLFKLATSFFVPEVDKAYVQIKPQVQGSEIAHDVAQSLGVAESMGLTGQGAGLPVSPTPSAPVLAVEQEAVVQQYPVYSPASSISIDGRTVDICGWASQTEAYLCDETDQPSSNTITVPTTGGGDKTSQSSEPVVGGMTRAQWFAQMGECWLGWANTQAITSSEAKWGLQALPAGTTWNLTSPKNWKKFWTNMTKETWYLSSSELGIENYPINGVLARSFPGAANGVVVLKGLNTDFLGSCGIPALSTTTP